MQELDTPYTYLANGDAAYVHLCSGRVERVQPATAIRTRDQTLEVMHERTVVASFPRSTVYFVADERVEPSPA